MFIGRKARWHCTAMPGFGWVTGAVRHACQHSFARDGALLALTNCVTAGVGLLTNIVAARMLSPADYGTVAIVIAYPTLMRSFVSFKSPSVTTRYLITLRTTGSPEAISSLCKLGYLLDFLAAVVAFGLVSATGWWVTSSVYKTPQAAWLMIVYAASFPLFSLIGTGWAILTAWQDFWRLSLLQVFYKLSVLLLVLSFLHAGLGVRGVVLANVLGHVTIGIVTMTLTTSLLRRHGYGRWWRAPLRAVTPLLKELGAFFGWNYVAVTLNGLISQVPLLLLGMLRGPEDAGYYRLATSLTTVGSYLESAMGRVIYPVLATHWSVREWEGFRGALQRWTFRGGFPVGVLVLLTIPALSILVPWVFGPGYIPMVAGAQVMMVGAVVSTVFFWLHAFYYAVGRADLWTKAYGLYTGFSIGVGWWCIQQWGFAGLAWAMMLGKVLCIALLLYCCGSMTQEK